MPDQNARLWKCKTRHISTMLHMNQEQTRPPGRPRTIQGEQTKMVVRMSQEQRDKVDRLGGAAWLRARIDEAAEPQETQSPRAPWARAAG